MTTSKNINSFRDVHDLFLLAMERGQIELEYLDLKSTYREVARLNAYRRLLRKANVAQGLPDACEFDHLVVRHVRDETGPTNRVNLEFRRPAVLQIRDGQTGESLAIPTMPTAIPLPASKEEQDFLAEALSNRQPILRR